MTASRKPPVAEPYHCRNCGRVVDTERRARCEPCNTPVGSSKRERKLTPAQECDKLAREIVGRTFARASMAAAVIGASLPVNE